MSTVFGFVGFESEIYVFVVHVPFAFSVPRLSSSGWTRKTAPRASHSVTPKQKKPVQRSFHHLEFIHTCTKKHIWRNHVRVLSGGMRTAPLSEFTFFCAICGTPNFVYFFMSCAARAWTLIRSILLSMFLVFFEKKKTKYRKKKISRAQY